MRGSQSGEGLKDTITSYFEDLESFLGRKTGSSTLYCIIRVKVAGDLAREGGNLKSGVGERNHL